MAPQLDAIIVGAGFGGMGAAITLKDLGLGAIEILDREDGVGGTWHVNHYPGLAVDIASVTYSYSFEPNPYWSRMFAPGRELKCYAEHIADKYDLRRHLRLGVTVVDARWDASAQQWTVTSADGARRTARYLLAATGFLSQPRTPDIPGVDDFSGTVVHTAKWDDDYDPAGRRIAVIGTGATAVQLIPELARTAAELTVYQRTPIWVVPKVDLPVPKTLQRLFAAAPITQRIARTVNSAALEAMMVTAVLHFTQAKALNSAAAALARAHLFAQVRDRRLREALTPDYDFGCKRPTFSNGYFRAFTRPAVHLETAGIERITADSVVSRDGRRRTIDTLVLATGFNLWDTNFPAFPIVGRDDADLGLFWRTGRFQAYEGISVPKFPNFLSLNSPYSYSGLSYFDTIESQMLHVRRLVGRLRATGHDTFEVTAEANADFLDRMTERLRSSVFNAGSCGTARSYYFDPHGEAVLLRPTSTANAYRAQREFPTDAYTLTGGVAG